MHLSSVLPFALFTSLISAQAPPNQIPLQDEKVQDEGSHVTSCTIKLPTSYQQISSSAPSKSFPQNNIFNVSQTSGSKDNTVTLLRFSGIPPGSYGCQLSMSFTYQYPIFSSGSTQLNVYALGKTISSGDTYATYFPNGGRGTPKDSFLFGTTTVNGQRAVVNSEVCSTSLSFLFEIASETQDGSVTFADAGNNLSGIGGFYLTYNC